MAATTFDTAVVKKMVDQALDFAAREVGHQARAQTMAALKNGDCSVCGYVLHGLAHEVATYLGSVDSSVKAIYTYEPEYATGADGPMPDQPNLSPAISMLAWVDRKSAALVSVVNILSSAVTEELKRFGCPKANALCHTLDVELVDEDQVLGRIGYGALIDSVYVRPMEIWRR